MAVRLSLVGAAVAAVAGGVGRAAVTAAHLGPGGETALGVVLVAAAVGAIIGALSGLAGRPLLGAVIGAALSAVAYLGILPVLMLFRFLGAPSAPSLLEVAGVGALAGALGGLAESRAGRRRARLSRGT